MFFSQTDTVPPQANKRIYVTDTRHAFDDWAKEINIFAFGLFVLNK